MISAELLRTITAAEAAVRDRPLEEFCRDASAADLLGACTALDRFRRTSENLYERVRALFFLSSRCRYQLPAKLPADAIGLVPYEGFVHLLNRRFDEAIEEFLAAASIQGMNDSLASALARAYHELGFQTLADQVRRSVRSVRGNQWMFRVGHPADHPLRVRGNVGIAGESGELTSIEVGHYSNLINHMMTLIVGQRPAFDAKAASADHKSMSQAIRANSLMEMQ